MSSNKEYKYILTILLVLKYNFAKQELTKLREENLYRILKRVSLQRSGRAIVNGKQVINLCSNDYLGLSENKCVLREMKKKLTRVSQCSSRLMCGNSVVLEQLEQRLANHRRTESSLVYPAGYMANIGVISVLADKDSIVFSDELNHASIIDGCGLSRAVTYIFKHNDINDLEKLIMRKTSMSSGKKIIIITEGLFSMDGDMSRLREICDIAKKYDAMTMVDDAHGDFIFGASNLFSGVPSHQRVTKQIDVHISSLSKALGCFGGYVATTHTVREFLINKSRQFIYTSALPDHLCASALLAISISMKGHLQKRLFSNVLLLKKKLADLGFLIGQTKGQIIPVIVGNENLALEFSNDLLDNGVLAQAVRYPTVKKGSARLRVTVTSLLTNDDLACAISSFETAGKKCEII
jgi:glycine C-acetyltransferase